MFSGKFLLFFFLDSDKWWWWWWQVESVFFRRGKLIWNFRETFSRKIIAFIFLYGFFLPEIKSYVTRDWKKKKFTLFKLNFLIFVNGFSLFSSIPSNNHQKHHHLSFAFLLLLLWILFSGNFPRKNLF